MSTPRAAKGAIEVSQILGGCNGMHGGLDFGSTLRSVLAALASRGGSL